MLYTGCGEIESKRLYRRWFKYPAVLTGVVKEYPGRGGAESKTSEEESKVEKLSAAAMLMNAIA